MDTFTIVTGLASLFGFALQAFNVFPEHARGRQALWMLVMGGFVGGVLTALDFRSVQLDVKLTGYTISMTVLAALILFFAIMAAFTQNHTRRRGFYIVGGLAALAFTITTSVVSLVGTVTDSDLVRQDVVNEQELEWLLDRARERGDIARQVHHLDLLIKRLDAADERRPVLEMERASLKGQLDRSR
ncbi:hypothetical protein GTZ97_13920 [Aquabacterium fontiphilum]|jgi:hypothetical protein|uniref:hypothetical protein n=1 Tax=Aquabacterium fontiphilum TaxID=450365 RepID=UPI001377B464|nr:hypothetical protein [Aquabacterium fontiphilum]NBD21762.1 hypothetical protein [Aquabacterium fontiphilum]